MQTWLWLQSTPWDLIAAGTFHQEACSLSSHLLGLLFPFDLALPSFRHVKDFLCQQTVVVWKLFLTVDTEHKPPTEGRKASLGCPSPILANPPFCFTTVIHSWAHLEVLQETEVGSISCCLQICFSCLSLFSLKSLWHQLASGKFPLDLKTASPATFLMTVNISYWDRETKLGDSWCLSCRSMNQPLPGRLHLPEPVKWFSPPMLLTTNCKWK